jgi:hypothetical protein
LRASLAQVCEDKGGPGRTGSLSRIRYNYSVDPVDPASGNATSRWISRQPMPSVGRPTREPHGAIGCGSRTLMMDRCSHERRVKPFDDAQSANLKGSAARRDPERCSAYAETIPGRCYSQNQSSNRYPRDSGTGESFDLITGRRVALRRPVFLFIAPVLGRC